MREIAQPMEREHRLKGGLDPRPIDTPLSRATSKE
jgi:hypothetical protein